MIEATREIALDMPVSTVFAYVTDYRTWRLWCLGLERVEVIGERATGVGAQFEGRTRVGKLGVKCRLLVTGWETNRLIAAETTAGIKAAVTFVLSAPAPRRTMLSVHFGYALPGGVVGRTLRPLMSPFVCHAMDHIEANLREQLPLAGVTQGARL
ncbi:SRPBCC family protein [Mycobacterium sp. shizuoka-1]|uniref:SRPBCC family protein n=1 Tax=Mycobacterium sp. shizuoka-1 TaxID=2039281 RepID=UPI000C066FF8|nr:SRPBCC family protein [Mycobacterium sp. shizuoka-1]GAY13863.1 hypothetical protein MSZK_05890 [Mycobacterium sp. shizuoka-1]